VRASCSFVAAALIGEHRRVSILADHQRGDIVGQRLGERDRPALVSFRRAPLQAACGECALPRPLLLEPVEAVRKAFSIVEVPTESSTIFATQARTAAVFTFGDSNGAPVCFDPTAPRAASGRRRLGGDVSLGS
jgi:hypothetical protein